MCPVCLSNSSAGTVLFTPHLLRSVNVVELVSCFSLFSHGKVLHANCFNHESRVLFCLLVFSGELTGINYCLGLAFPFFFSLDDETPVFLLSADFHVSLSFLLAFYIVSKKNNYCLTMTHFAASHELNCASTFFFNCFLKPTLIKQRHQCCCHSICPRISAGRS